MEYECPDPHLLQYSFINEFTLYILSQKKLFSKKKRVIFKDMENVKFRNSDGVEYELIWKKPHYTYNADGLCYSPEMDNPKILVDPKLKKRRKLSTLIEEVTHAFFWDKSEKEVRKFSSVLSGLISKQIK
tara:strand:- start:800 stop:1189 length:390 start_codon:yes stop_codon:yes gene_type:complete